MSRNVLLVLSALTLAGCASMSGQPPVAAQEPDFARVAAINRAAQQAGVKVIWLNMPHRAVPAPAPGG